MQAYKTIWMQYLCKCSIRKFVSSTTTSVTIPKNLFEIFIDEYYIFASYPPLPLFTPTSTSVMFLPFSQTHTPHMYIHIHTQHTHTYTPHTCTYTQHIHTYITQINTGTCVHHTHTLLQLYVFYWNWPLRIRVQSYWLPVALHQGLQHLLTPHI